MTARVAILVACLSLCAASAAMSDEPKPIEITKPVGNWENRLDIKQDRLVWKINYLTVKADYAITKDSILYGVVTEVTGKSKEIEEGDTFSFRFRVDDDTMNLKELKGRFVGEAKQKQELEGIHRRVQSKK